MTQQEVRDLFLEVAPQPLALSSTVLKVVQDVVINHSSQYGIRGKVFIDHLPIKYYRPAGGAPIT